MKKYTWKPDLPDYRDYKFSESVATLPTKVDLRTQYTNVYDQGQLGSCTANAISMAYDFERVKQSETPLLPSRLFIYYNERLLEHTVKQDSGAMIRDGIKVLATSGVCSETSWPYIITKFKSKPKKKCYTEASQNLIKQYLRIDNSKITDLKTCLSLGYGFVFGFTVYESFESQEVASTGIVPIPDFKNESVLGGHAVFCVGYDDSKNSFIVRNSWGTGWGDGGHFYIPYQYLTDTNLADDFWTIRTV
jgi:C1A family cysteine protease